MPSMTRGLQVQASHNRDVAATKMTILLDAPDWVVAGGIRRVLEEADHDDAGC